MAQSYFEYLKIPYTHSGVVSSYNAMNKIISKEIFKKNRILTPQYFTLSRVNFLKVLKKFKKKGIKFPVVVKPIDEGSSLGVKISKNINELTKFTKYLFKKYEQLMFEKFIGGQEIQAAVLNSKSLGAIELIPKDHFMIIKQNTLNRLKQST